MADASHIEWTDATWNPVTGCSVVSPGCTNCYAMRLAGTRLQHHHSRSGLTVDSKAGPVWNGQVRLNEGWLTQPLLWKRPRRIFVCAHGDLFHESVPDAWIDKVFAVMALAPQHTFQVLTKRAERMRAYFEVLAVAARLQDEDPDLVPSRLDRAAVDVTNACCAGGSIEEAQWPLANVWLGVSVEDQARADERIPILLDTPAAVRWISAEPLLGPIDLRHVQTERHVPEDHEIDWKLDSLSGGFEFLDDLGVWCDGDGPQLATLDWVVAGGESGPGARPMHPDWARQIRDDCAAAGVPFLFKQWGNWLPERQFDEEGFQWAPGSGAGVHWWAPEPAEGQPLPDGAVSIRIGKRRAGRALDRATHDAYPEAR